MVIMNLFNTLCIFIQILIYFDDKCIVCHLMWIVNICLLQKIKCFPGEMVQMVD